MSWFLPKELVRFIFALRNVAKTIVLPHALGCLLSIISTIRPDGEFIIDVSGVFPKVASEESNGKEVVQDFLTVVRDALAHHCRENNLLETEEGEIVSIKFAHHKGKNPTEELTISELDTIINNLYKKIRAELGHTKHLEKKNKEEVQFQDKIKNENNLS